MNIIPDTNIFIDFWKRPTESIKKIFDEEDVIICGPVRAELLQGALSVKDFNKMVDLFGAFKNVDISTDDWVTLGRNLYLLRTHGKTVPLADAIIATLAIKFDIPVWTRDKHFPLMKEVLSDLKIFVE